MEESGNEVKSGCNCIKVVAKNIVEKMSGREHLPNGYKVVDSEWVNKAIFPKEKLYAEFRITSTFTKVNGSTSKPKNENINIYFSFCPFCGKKIN
jgi:hypothetical protein